MTTGSGTRYTRERLAEAAATCKDIDAVVAFLGAKPYGQLRRYLMGRFTHFGIDVSHFPPFGRGNRPGAHDLRNAVAGAHSVREALRRLGRADNGAQRANLRRWVAEEGLSTAHFLGQGHQRGKRGPTAKRPEDVLVRHGNGRRTTTKTLRRALQEVGTPEQCARCGIGPEWLGKPMTLEIDHVNGDWSDDRRENLRLLCPNCHATTTTWCRGGARYDVRQLSGGGAMATQQT
ncbi:HNH endonuclease signature motif containing protein [Streptomyces sp. NPDC015661]|uniref:HNH endonuclease signature motif containing protein n=1 Tax=Streptomyces sp. NPDC015661 TaxID=3364961 RepID=UPI0036FB4E5E